MSIAFLLFTQGLLQYSKLHGEKNSNFMVKKAWIRNEKQNSVTNMGVGTECMA